MADPISIIIKNRRIHLGMTQHELAEKAGMSDKTYQRIEQGSTDMRMSQYRTLIKALHMSDLDVSLDLLEIESATAWDVAAAARVLLPSTRFHLVKSIMEEWQRKEVQVDIDVKVKK
ncbi:helix-turn-helix transcriptional regulator [Photobacterium leiognathi subsp. mandapamensis]|uniref:helix-turn-helix transcriptional regulator n=1 Tax=Photobacterium leiognathi TaxID=553611 RepID=UPI002980D552|nr:helix-turn-helix transcriptional regulator [Photobacterium leiognathi]